MAISPNLIPLTPDLGALRSPKALAIATDDGMELAATLFTPVSGAARGTVLFNGAAAVPMSFYKPFAEFLARAGLRVLTYDYRGIGGSRPLGLRGFQATMTDWAVHDARAAFELAESLGPEPIVLVGHSFGGQLLGLIDEPRRAAGVLLVGAQFGYYGNWSGAERVRLALLLRGVLPAATSIFGYLPGWLGLDTDLPAGVANEWARWCSHPEYLMGHSKDARERFARFDRPILFYSFSDDAYAPKPAVDQLLGVLSHAPLTHVRIDPRDLSVANIGHFGFFRSRFERTLWQPALEGIDALLDGRPPLLDGSPASEPTDPFGFDVDEVLEDLAYGRS